MVSYKKLVPTVIALGTLAAFSLSGCARGKKVVEPIQEPEPIVQMEEEVEEKTLEEKIEIVEAPKEEKTIEVVKEQTVEEPIYDTKNYLIGKFREIYPGIDDWYAARTVKTQDAIHELLDGIDFHYNNLEERWQLVIDEKVNQIFETGDVPGVIEQSVKEYALLSKDEMDEFDNGLNVILGDLSNFFSRNEEAVAEVRASFEGEPEYVSAPWAALEEVYLALTEPAVEELTTAAIIGQYFNAVFPEEFYASLSPKSQNVLATLQTEGAKQLGILAQTNPEYVDALGVAVDHMVKTGDVDGAANGLYSQFLELPEQEQMNIATKLYDTKTDILTFIDENSDEFNEIYTKGQLYLDDDQKQAFDTLGSYLIQASDMLAPL